VSRVPENEGCFADPKPTGGERPKAAAPTCPDCGQEIVFTMCRVVGSLSAETVAALRDLVLAVHRQQGCSGKPTLEGG
jgi:hypothetical protein